MRKLLTFILFVLLPVLTVFAQQPDSVITEFLSASVITEGNITYKVDRTTHFFSSEEVKAARDGRELVATVPNLFIDKQSNTLATLAGKKILILINGIKSTDADLQLIPASKIKKVDFYDVPPVRYMDMADIVLNVITSRLDTGWNGSVYARAGQMYSHGDVALSRVSGNNKLTVNLGSHFNHKRKVWDEETGEFSYRLGDDEYKYEYSQRQREWGNQYSGGVAWLNGRPGDYMFQISADYSFYNNKMGRDRDIDFTLNGLGNPRSGVANNDVTTMKPTVDVYFEKTLSEVSTLMADVTATSYSNDQNAFTSETGVFEDVLDLSTRKNSVIGELVYSYAKENRTFNAGYKGTFGFLRSDLAGSGVSKVRTGRQRLYGEYSSRHGSFSYRVSLGAENNMRAGDDGFSRFAFSPTLLFSYRLNKRNILRLRLDSETMMPDLQQMSCNRILIMENFYRRGSADVHNSTGYQSRLIYSYNIPRKLIVQTDAHYNRTGGFLYDAFVQDGGAWYLETRNAHHYSETGMNMIVTYLPWTWLRLGVDFSADRQTIKETASGEAYSDWFFPVYLNASAVWGGWSLSYRQTYGGKMLDGLYRKGLERVSYLSLTYDWKNWRFGAQCLFPFYDDKYSNETIAVAPIRHLTHTNLRTKNREFGFTISWFFQRGKENHSAKSLENSDVDSGVFRF